jgi:hypothetical protein
VGEHVRLLADDPQTVVPDFLLRRAQSSTAPKMFAAIRDRVR